MWQAYLRQSRPGLGLGSKAQRGVEVRVYGLGFGVDGLGLGFGVDCADCRIQGSGCGV